jgi:hypothetical protein
MKNFIPFGFRARRVGAMLATIAASLLLLSTSASAESWNGIEPLKSRRSDVERVLGFPLKDQPGMNGTLRFKVAGGSVTIAFVDARFVATKKLSPGIEGTVRQIVLHHDNSSDSPESMGLSKKSDFKREEKDGVVKYSNLKEGIVYTFMGGKLKSSYFTPTTGEWARAQK